MSEFNILVSVFHELHALSVAQNFQHAAVKVYVQLLQSLSVGEGDHPLVLAMKELKTFVEPTTGLSQAAIWKALLTSDMESVEAKVSQLMIALKQIDTCEQLVTRQITQRVTHILLSTP